jgi:exopolysaccharide biosynthesis protein
MKRKAEEEEAARKAAEQAAREAMEELEEQEALKAQKALEIDTFYNAFAEIDRPSFEVYLEQHPEVLDNGYENPYEGILINETSLSSEGTGLYSAQGDEILAVDAENGILILRVTGSGYKGKLAIINDASKVCVAPASRLGSYGDQIGDIVKNNNAVLGINASGFADYEGVGSGGIVDGLLICNGEKLANRTSGYYSVIGFGYDDRLYIGQNMSEAELRDAVEFYPAEVINGVDVTAGSNGFGIEPRTAIGQAANGDVMLLTIDGRQVGYSLGTTVGVCAEIFLRYGAVQASNLDGGSSTAMFYRGEYITRPANGTAFGRLCPDAILVKGW